VPDERLARGYARGRERDEAIRAQLAPLGPDERPLGLRLAVALAALLALANVVAVLAGANGRRTAGLVFAAVMALAAVGMWRRRYWAVLGFEVLLGISIVYAALSLAFASNLAGVALCLAVIGLCGPVFWLLVRVMARLQLPSRPSRGAGP
jgi:hypothetical protein